MTIEELIDEAKKKETFAMGRFEAYEKVIQQINRLQESARRKGNESNMEIERHKTPQNSDRRLYEKTVHNYALANGYCDILNMIMKSYNNCKEEYIKDLQNIAEQMEELKKAQQNDGATIIDEKIHDQ